MNSYRKQVTAAGLEKVLDSINQREGGVELHSETLQEYLAGTMEKPVERVTLYVSGGDVFLMVEIGNGEDEVIAVTLAEAGIRNGAA